MASDAEYWSEQLAKLERGQLETVEKAATAWSALLAGLLGVFGVVAFAGGLTSIDKLPAPWDERMKWLTLLAAAALAISTYFAAKAAGNLSPKNRVGMTWMQLEAETRKRAAAGLGYFNWAKQAGAVAAVIVLLGSVIVLFLDEEKNDEESGDVANVLAVIDGTAICGPLGLSDRDELTVDGIVLKGRRVSFTIVPSCPVEE